MTRKRYDRQFKVAAVKHVIEEQYSVSQVAKELEVHENSIYNWIRDYEKYGDSAFPGNGNPIYNYQYEIRKLEKENQDLREELELLKKFRAFLKKKQV